MNKFKINLDRINISSNEITQKMNFDDILLHQKIMAKPFYKSNWFYGVTGLASITLVAGSFYTLTPEGDSLSKNTEFTVESAPLFINRQNIIPKSEPLKENNTPIIKSKENNKPIAKTSTLKEIVIQPQNKIEELTENSAENITEQKNKQSDQSFSFVDLYPRISGKINGNITRDQLLNDKGLITNSNVKIISFELHLVTISGGEVYNNNGNTLNSEMKSALNKVPTGGEIYFENIDGQATTGEIVRLSPLRYVLLN